MTSKISVFSVLVAVSVFGALIGACGDGEISGTPRSPDGTPLDVNEPAPGPLDAGVPVPGVTGVPYGHVKPTDVGVTIGVGVVSAVPTAEYTGTCTPAPGATIENVVINNCQTINIENPNITFRNVIINPQMPSFYTVFVRGDDGEDSSGLTIEYSKLTGPSSDLKVFRAESATSGGPVQNYRNITLRNNEITGGHDWFYADGDLDGLLVENNYFHSTAASGGRHADGFQIGEHPEFGETRGTLTFSGNYFDPNTDFDKMNAILFMTGSESGNNTTVYWESNYIHDWGWTPIRCSDADACIIRYNVYEQSLKALFSGPGLPSHAVWYNDNCANCGPSEFTCNRYEDGTFIEQADVRDVTHNTTGCPSYSP